MAFIAIIITIIKKGIIRIKDINQLEYNNRLAITELGSIKVDS